MYLLLIVRMHTYVNIVKYIHTSAYIWQSMIGRVMTIYIITLLATKNLPTLDAKYLIAVTTYTYIQSLYIRT